eukprot:2991258-Pyramimonas_sp.AAC.1
MRCRILKSGRCNLRSVCRISLLVASAIEASHGCQLFGCMGYYLDPLVLLAPRRSSLAPPEALA